MPGESKNGMQCSEFDALLTEALDGTLAGAKLERFRAHATVCSVCGPLFAEVDAGRRLLLSLEEIEPPAHLMNSILAATSGFDTARLHTAAQRQLSLVDRIRAWAAPVFNPFFGVIRQPRFAMSFGMAFFSVTMALNVAGVKMTDLRHIQRRRDNNNTSGQPEQRQERNYSQGENTPVLAFAPDVPVVTVPAIRRIV
jgi:hypothetical protein